MVNIRNLIAVLCVAAGPLGAYAQNKDEHQEHHPAGAVAAAPGKAAPLPAERMAAMDQHMKAMQAMREKMATAKTPAERQALMAEHMKLMQEGMAMMGQMRGMMGMQGMQGMQGGPGMAGPAAERQQMMEKRMDMMESMMQMMMDRLPPTPANR